MAFDTPATIAVLGGGPIGLEAALYARFLGYQVEIFEQGADVCDHVRQWEQVDLFTPFGMNRSTLGIAAISAQDEQYRAPKDAEIVSGKRWRDDYLVPLSQTDLLIDSLHLNCRVTCVSKPDYLKYEKPGDPQRSESGFSILVSDLASEITEERTYDADIVIDTTGVLSQPNFVGTGGAPAVGERVLRSDQDSDLPIFHTPPDCAGEQRDRFANRSTLLIGSGYSAATSVCSLAELAQENADTQVTWVSRRKNVRPINEIPEDSLAERSLLTRRANELAANNLASTENGWLSFLVETSVSEIRYDKETRKFIVQLRSMSETEEPSAESLEFDNIINNTGYRPDVSLFRELQVHQCYATEGPMRLAAKLLGEQSADCLEQTTHGAESLITTEPNFYVLGSKSFGRNSSFLYSIGLQQIRELFALIGDRADLDLYASSAKLAQDESNGESGSS